MFESGMQTSDLARGADESSTARHDEHLPCHVFCTSSGSM